MNLLMTQDNVKVFLHGADAQQATQKIKRMRNVPDPVSVQENTDIDITLQFADKSHAKIIARKIEQWYKYGAPWDHSSSTP